MTERVRLVHQEQTPVRPAESRHISRDRTVVCTDLPCSRLLSIQNRTISQSLSQHGKDNFSIRNSTEEVHVAICISANRVRVSILQREGSSTTPTLTTTISPH